MTIERDSSLRWMPHSSWRSCKSFWDKNDYVWEQTVHVFSIVWLFWDWKNRFQKFFIIVFLDLKFFSLAKWMSGFLEIFYCNANNYFDTENHFLMNKFFFLIFLPLCYWFTMKLNGKWMQIIAKLLYSE